MFTSQDSAWSLSDVIPVSFVSPENRPRHLRGHISLRNRTLAPFTPVLDKRLRIELSLDELLSKTTRQEPAHLNSVGVTLYTINSISCQDSSFNFLWLILL